MGGCGHEGMLGRRPNEGGSVGNSWRRSSGR